MGYNGNRLEGSQCDFKTEIKIILAESVTIKFQYKLKIRLLLRREPFALSYYIKAMIYLVYTWLSTILERQYKTYQLSFQKMACNLTPQCNFLYKHFQCDFPEDTTDVEITRQTLKGIQNFRKDHTTQKFMCSPWEMQVKPLPIITKEN